ncbi:MFS transporter [Actinoplanes sp. NPDC051411]|uniref:MFS transporter n=1 Tax=Actinoplanes sp. NPDC051411 TaxID=3155522 RepID=UPI0034298BDA
MWVLLVRHGAFRRLWLAATVDAFGTWLLVTAVPVEVFARTGSPTSTAVALAVEAGPALVLGPWAGALVDRLPRVRVLLAADLVAAAGVAAMLVPGVGFLYLGVAVESVAVCFLAPGVQATVPLVAPDLAAANTALAVSQSTWRVLGPLTGAAVTAAGWFPVAVAADAVSYLAAGVIVAGMAVPAPAGAAMPAPAGGAAQGEPMPVGTAPGSRIAPASGATPTSAGGATHGGPKPAGAPSGGDPKSASTDGTRPGDGATPAVLGLRPGDGTKAAVLAGLRLIRREPVLRALLAGSWVYWTANAGLTALLVPFVAGRLHASGAAVGYLVTGLGVGYLAGSTVTRRLLVRGPGVIAGAYALVGVCFLVLVTARTLPVAVAAVTASGLPGAAALAATGYRLQVGAPDALRGRVAAAFRTSDALAAVAGALAAPLLVAAAGLEAALVVLAGAVPVAALIMWSMLRGLPRSRWDGVIGGWR